MYKLSTPNLLRGTVAAVKEGAVNGTVAIDTPCGLVKADITMGAIVELGIREGIEATAVMSPADVLLEVGDEGMLLSAGNRLEGVVESVVRGAVSAHVIVRLADGAALVSNVGVDDVCELGLEPGLPVTAVVGANDVLVSTEA